jgi:hypothetical protein
MIDNPFDNIENAHKYLSLLGDAVAEAQCQVREDIEGLGSARSRRKEALKLVAFKLSRLNQNLGSSRFILNDLRMLRRLLLGERENTNTIDAGGGSPDATAPPAFAADRP